MADSDSLGLTLASDLSQLSTAEAKYKGELTTEAARVEQSGKDFESQVAAFYQPGIDAAKEFAAGQQPFNEPVPVDQINQVMSGAPWLFALAALGGAAAKVNGQAMLQGLNGISDGMIKGDQQALDNGFKKYDADFQKWKARSDQQFRSYSVLADAYGSLRDGKMRALEAVLKMTNDSYQNRITADDPDTHFKMRDGLIDAHARLLEAQARWKEAQTKAKAASMGADPNSVENVAQMVASYRMAPLSSFVMKSPWGQAVMSRVSELNPDYQAAEFGSRSKAYRDFATGKQGDQVRALNVSIQHLDTMRDLVDALRNGDIKRFNQAALVAEEETGHPAPTNFDAAKQIVGLEVVKGVIAGGGGVTERQEAEKQLDRANSTEALLGVLNTYTTLLGGQMRGLRQQFETTTGRKDFESLLLEDSKRALEATGKPQSFATADDAQKARDAGKIKPGDKIIVNGVPGHWED